MGLDLDVELVHERAGELGLGVRVSVPSFLYDHKGVLGKDGEDPTLKISELFIYN